MLADPDEVALAYPPRAAAPVRQATPVPFEPEPAFNLQPMAPGPAFGIQAVAPAAPPQVPEEGVLYGGKKNLLPLSSLPYTAKAQIFTLSYSCGCSKTLRGVQHILIPQTKLRHEL